MNNRKLPPIELEIGLVALGPITDLAMAIECGFVRCINADTCSDLTEGKTYIVSDVDYRCEFQHPDIEIVDDAGDNTWVDSCDFELMSMVSINASITESNAQEQ